MFQFQFQLDHLFVRYLFLYKKNKIFFVLVTRQPTTPGDVNTTPIPACTTPVELINSPNTYFSSVTVDTKRYGKAPFPTSFDMTQPSMTVQFNIPNYVC
jgi:hypothetical protein